MAQREHPPVQTRRQHSGIQQTWQTNFEYTPTSTTNFELEQGTSSQSLASCTACHRGVTCPSTSDASAGNDCQVRRACPAVTMFRACPYCLASFLCHSVVSVSVFSVSWSLICFKDVVEDLAVEGLARVGIATRVSRLLCVTGTAWRKPR